MQNSGQLDQIEDRNISNCARLISLLVTYTTPLVGNSSMNWLPETELAPENVTKLSKIVEARRAWMPSLTVLKGSRYRTLVQLEQQDCSASLSTPKLKKYKIEHVVILGKPM